MLTAAAVLLGGVIGWKLGMLRATAMLLAVLGGGAVAWNWGLPLAERLVGPKAPAAAFWLLLLQVSATGLFAWMALRAIRDAAPMPPYFERIGGTFLGAAAAWVAFGVAFAALRAGPACNEFALRQRGGVLLDVATPDGWWLRTLEHLSARGLAPSPPHAFDAVRDFLPSPTS